MFNSFSKIMYLCVVFYFFGISSSYSQALVSAEWLEKNICKENLIVLEVHTGKRRYEAAHIPCSVYTNFYESGWRVKVKNIPLMLPSVEHLKTVLQDHGISNDDKVIVVASGRGEYSMAETTSIYFTLKYIGHNDISILDGGAPAWFENWDRDSETGYKKQKKSIFHPRVNNDIIANKEDVLLGLNNKIDIIDGRSSDFYMGINNTDPSLRYGTIAGAKNIPNQWLLKNGSLYFHKKENLEKIINNQGIDFNKPQISFCNAGLESSIVWFALSEILKNSKSKLYESSLAEWSKDKSLPMESFINIENGDNDELQNDYSMEPN